MAAVCAGNRVLVLDVQVRGGCGRRAQRWGPAGPHGKVHLPLVSRALTGRVSGNTLGE